MKLLLWSGAGVLLVLLLTPLQAAAGELRVGTAAVDLEADDSMVIAGGIAPAKATGQEGKLRSVAVVIEKEPMGKVAIVACDVLFVPGDMVDRALAAAQKTTGIPPERVLVNATHTHHAPSITDVHGYTTDEVFKKRVEEAITKSIEQANARLDGGESAFLFRMGEEKTIGANSRLRMKDGKIFWVGPMTDAVGPTGPFDPQLPVLAFRAAGGDKLRGVIFNHSTHTIGSRKGAVRSPSFYGLAAQELEDQLGATVCFLEGASGSTHIINGIGAAQAVETMKAAVSQALEQAEEHPVERLASIKRPFAFKVRTFDEKVEEEKVVSYCTKYIGGDPYTIGVFRAMRKRLAPDQGKERTTTIQAIRIGDVAIVGVPAEYFTVLGLDIKKRSPFKHTVIAELANDWVGYMPNREGHKDGGYQTWMGLHSYAEEGTGERVADQAVEMLKELAKE